MDIMKAQNHERRNEYEKGITYYRYHHCCSCGGTFDVEDRIPIHWLGIWLYFRWGKLFVWEYQRFLSVIVVINNPQTEIKHSANKTGA